MIAIQTALSKAEKYAESYPGDLDHATREAIFFSHLAYLVNESLKDEREGGSMDWYKAAAVDVIWEAREKFGKQFNLKKCDITTLRKLLAGDLVILDLGKGKFTIIEKGKVAEYQEFVKRMADERVKETRERRARSAARAWMIRGEERVKRPKVMTEKQLRKHLRDVAKDTVGDGFDLQDCAYDLAECQLLDPGVQLYLKHRESWAVTKQQKIEFIAGLIHE